MLAARSSGGGVGGGHQPPHAHRKQSVASLSGTKAHRSSLQDAKRNSSSGKQGSQQRHKAALIREMETNWYLKMFGLGKEETVAHKTGMSYSDSPAHILSSSEDNVTVLNARGQN
ncbi:hypothetical protein PAMP_018799 [Pampus punctatissimus]